MKESKEDSMSASEEIDSSSFSEFSRKGRKKPRANRNLQLVKWTEEEDRKLFMLYKLKGSCWSSIATEFRNRNENQVKNRFYSTLRRMAVKVNTRKGEQTHKARKEDLIKYVDDALVYGHHCRSKRGRKRRAENSQGIDKEENKNTEVVESVQVRNMIESPEYIDLLITNNNRLLADLDEKVTSDTSKTSLLQLREGINGQLRSTQEFLRQLYTCLLYTSDAADE
eukprot:TRINITY_DN7355_c0_g1_i13.p1 TRINITY_DN7355_c0_g1~~TRINITY_DN7355_c0_g1_i13.p1  ORF type:complete len:225 (-),score=88.91 TRINITY_DN7355_c0_g1_i13:58-732(-)